MPFGMNILNIVMLAVLRLLNFYEKNFEPIVMGQINHEFLASLSSGLILGAMIDVRTCMLAVKETTYPAYLGVLSSSLLLIIAFVALMAQTKRAKSNIQQGA